MTKSNFLVLTSMAGLFIVLTAEVLSDNGKAGYTGSPGEQKCNNCHNDFTLGTGGGSIAFTSPNMNNWQYAPGQVYTFNVTVARNASSLFGMGLEALTSTNSNAGTFTMTNPSTSLKTKTVSGVVRNNVCHTLNGGATAAAKTFTFNWTAPVTATGNVTVYFTGVAANGDGNEAGDYVYSGSQVLSPITTGVESLSLSNSLTVYPNPIKDNFNLSFELQKPENISAEILDCSGKQVLSVVRNEMINDKYSTQISLKDKGIKGGLYFLHVKQSNGNSVVKKLIIE